jgi:hypothetical protein
MQAIGCCQMNFILPSPYALPRELMWQGSNFKLIIDL